MKKLWKHEWKYHIGFLIIATVLLLSSQGDWCHFEWPSWEFDQEYFVTYHVLDRFGSSIMYEFLWNVVVIVFGMILLKKCFICWVEKDRSGREFFQTLPMTKRTRMQFHICMDMLAVIVPVLVYGVYGYNICLSNLERHQITIPWLGESIIGIMLVVISYVIMLLGVVYVVENLFVNGGTRIVGSGLVLAMLYMITEKIYQLFSNNVVVQKIYGFFTKASVAGNYYAKIQEGDNLDTFYGWVHDNCNPLIFYKGEQRDLMEMGFSAEEYRQYFSNWNQLFDFSNISSYIFHMLGYLVIGTVLIGIAVWLSDKRELSKEGFYFEFARYLFSGLLALSFYVMLMDTQLKMGQQILNIVAAVTVFVVLLYSLDLNRKPLFQRKVSE